MSYYKRGFLEISTEILNSLSSGELIKTHITFKCKLDSRAVSKYLKILLNNGFIKKSEGEPAFFIITKKGKEFLVQYNKLMDLIEIGETEIEESSVDQRITTIV
jgi:predicted transcriptional regulator